MEGTRRMLAYVQCLMMAASGDATCPDDVYRRLERIETYLIARYNRED